MATKERVIFGLENRLKALLQIREVGGRGCGVFAQEKIEKGSYICEYQSKVYEMKEKEKHLKEYEVNREGSYIIDMVGKPSLCFDATRVFGVGRDNYGRYINHAKRGVNCRPYPPLFIRGKYRVGFIALKDIQEGDELFWDYGCRGEEWMETMVEEGKVVNRGGRKEELAKSESPCCSKSLKTPKAPVVRRQRVCPVAGCTSKPQKRLSQHLDYKHPGLTHEERAYILRTARVLPRIFPPKATYLRPLKNTPSLEAYWNKEEEKEEDEEEEEEEECKKQIRERGTRSFKQFNVDREPSLIRFQNYLTRVEGGQRSQQQARLVAITVSKFLHFCRSTSLVPEWETLTESGLVAGYLNKLDEVGLNVEGKLNILENIGHAIDFYCFECGKDEKEMKKHRIAQRFQEEYLAKWKKSLRKSRKRIRQERMEGLSDKNLSFSQIKEVTKNKALRTLITSVAEQVRIGIDVPFSSLDKATIAIAGLLDFTTWQRPGAVCNATLEEWNAKKVVEVEGHQRVIFKVALHKSSVQGSAKFVLKDDIFSLLEEYVSVIRPKLCEAEKESRYLFITNGGCPLTSSVLRKKFSKLGQTCGFVPPTSTTVRKIIETSAATTLGENEQSLVATQLHHSTATAKQYYQAVIGSKQAVKAQVLIEGLGEEFPEAEECTETEQQSQPANESEDELSQISQLVRSESKGKEKQQGDSETPKKYIKKAFTKSQEETIITYFKTNIKNKQTIEIGEARKFMQLHPIPNKSPKNVQDKVRNLIGRR